MAPPRLALYVCHMAGVYESSAYSCSTRPADGSRVYARAPGHVTTRTYRAGLRPTRSRVPSRGRRHERAGSQFRVRLRGS